MKPVDWLKIYLPMWLANTLAIVVGVATDWYVVLIVITLVIWLSFGICVIWFSEKREVELKGIQVKYENQMISVLYHFRNNTRISIPITYHVVRIKHEGTARWVYKQGFKHVWILKPGEQVFESEQKTPKNWTIIEEGRYYFFGDATYELEGKGIVVSNECDLNWRKNKKEA